MAIGLRRFIYGALLVVAAPLAGHGQAPAIVHGQDIAGKHTFGFDKFFSRSSFGDIGIGRDDVAEPKEATELTVLTAGARLLEFRRNPRSHECWGFINHRKSSATANPIHIGIQMVFLYRNHGDEKAVFVQRNDKWVSRGKQKTTLQELEATRLVNVSLAQFAESHRDSQQLDHVDAGGLPLSEKWHARVPDDDSAAAASLLFWRKNPVDLNPSDSRDSVPLPKDYRDWIAAGFKIRADNRLIKFIATNQANPRAAPPFSFMCKDPDLQAIVFRVHLPGTPEFEKVFYLDL